MKRYEIFTRPYHGGASIDRADDGEWCRWEDVEPLIKEVERLSAWLEAIDGGDNPCTDPRYLREMARKAITLHHPAPGKDYEA